MSKVPNLQTRVYSTQERNSRVSNIGSTVYPNDIEDSETPGESSSIRRTVLSGGHQNSDSGSGGSPVGRGMSLVLHRQKTKLRSSSNRECRSERKFLECTTLLRVSPSRGKTHLSRRNPGIDVKVLSKW